MKMDEVIRKGVLMSGEEILECNKKIEEYTIVSKGMKEVKSELSLIEERKSDNTIESLYELLKIERVFLSNKRSRGIYERDKNRIKMVSVIGKLSTFGFMEDNQMYLRPYEALLLMEMNRLEVLYDTVVMSIEQGYAMFLDRKSDLSIEEYIVYSYISRIGYIIIKHDPEHDKDKYDRMEERKKVNKEDEMIFCVLMEKLNLPYSRDIIESDYELYLKTKNAMSEHSAAISGIIDNKNDESNHAEPPSKKLKSQNEDEGNNFLDILKTELEYLSYRHIYDKFNYISRKNFSHSDYENLRKLNFTFDIFLPKSNFKRTENLANYRILVIKSKEKFPTISELQNLREKQSYEVPIIIGVVSDNLTAHFSICTF